MFPRNIWDGRIKFCKFSIMILTAFPNLFWKDLCSGHFRNLGRNGFYHPNHLVFFWSRIFFSTRTPNLRARKKGHQPDPLGKYWAGTLCDSPTVMAHLVLCVIQGIQRLHFGNICNGTVKMKRNFKQDFKTATKEAQWFVWRSVSLTFKLFHVAWQRLRRHTFCLCVHTCYNKLHRTNHYSNCF